MKSRKLFALIGALPLVGVVAGCNSTDSVSPSHQRKFHDEPEVNTLSQVIVNGEKQGHQCPSNGNSRVLVVPVEFKDYPADEIGKYYNSETKDQKALKHTGDDVGTGRGAENAREDIRKVYFGDASETMWHSLSSYYKSVSYGNLNFNGIVLPWFKAYTDPETMEWCTAKQWSDSSSAALLAQNILSLYTDEMIQYYKTVKKQDGTDFTSGNDFLQYFDSDHDGCIDIVEMVYSAPYYATYTDSNGIERAIDNSKFWAYCGGTGTTGNVTSPKLSKWAWQSYYTIVEGGYYDENNIHRNWSCQQISNGEALVDAHTITHETGHALGLADYYDTDYRKHRAGLVDMMDHNVGDHDSYSKSLLGWVDPIVVTGPTQVTVRSFTDFGDCIYVPYRGYFEDHPTYGNTFYNEYLAIELYTPTGVNKADSEHKYAGNYPLCPSKPGLKVFHIDSRLGIFDYSSGTKKFVNYTDQIVSTGQSTYVMTATTNAYSDCEKMGGGLIEFMNHDSDSEIYNISDETIWEQGDALNDGKNYAHFVMNSRHEFGYKMVVDSLSADSATITFYAA